MFHEILSEKSQVSNDMLEIARYPIYDDTTKKLIVEPSIQ